MGGKQVAQPVFGAGVNDQQGRKGGIALQTGGISHRFQALQGPSQGHRIAR